jgi:fimbrial chaperone protein
MRFARTGLTLFLGLLAAATPGWASSLQISPIGLNLPANAAASKINLRNTGPDGLSAQIRVFKWMQVKGKDQLVETQDLVASPPIVKLDPGKNNVIRIVRTAKTPVAAEEAYRLVVDELPSSASKRRNRIGFVLRYSLPVFFAAPSPDGQKLTWSLESKGKQTTLVIANPANEHARITDLSITPRGGKTLNLGNGLLGYVLANSTARFPLKNALKGAAPGDTIVIAAQSNDEPVKAAAKVRAAD